MLMLKKVSPTRLVKGDFFREVEEAENRGATAEELKTLLGKGRAKKACSKATSTTESLK